MASPESPAQASSCSSLSLSPAAAVAAPRSDNISAGWMGCALSAPSGPIRHLELLCREGGAECPQALGYDRHVWVCREGRVGNYAG